LEPQRIPTTIRQRFIPTPGFEPGQRRDRHLAEKGHLIEKPTDLLKDPYILEFLDLPEHPHYSESDFEQALIDKLEHFLLELGKGFTFVGRQVRISFDEKHFKVDLVFFNRLLHCFVVIDLKGALSLIPARIFPSGVFMFDCF